MDNTFNPTEEFYKKANGILDAVEFSGDRSEVLSKLLATYILKVSDLLAQNEVVGPILQSPEKNSEIKSLNDIIKFCDDNNVEIYQGTFKQALNYTLQGFVGGFKENLSPEKVEELNKIIS